MSATAGSGFIGPEFTGPASTPGAAVSSGPTGAPAALDEGELRRQYGERLPRLEKLRAEAEWELKEGVRDLAVKLHSLGSRVKPLDSFIEKASRKGYSDPLVQTEDLVGVRAVCLFRSDLTRLEQHVRERFDVFHEEDTVEGRDPHTFGYMSVHMNARLRPEHVGPRYDDIKDLVFEVQLRTILMDAWANVSHYLDYKGESSIPSDLRRDFIALSGLFYVADQHFELFFRGAQESRAAALETATTAGQALQGDINLDTMLAYIAQKYPDRERSDAESVSELVEEIAGFGWTRLETLDKALDGIEPQFLAYEVDNPPNAKKGRRYADVGVVRISLNLVDPAYHAWLYGGEDEDED